jgi:hypothetical protein
MLCAGRVGHPRGRLEAHATPRRPRAAVDIQFGTGDPPPPRPDQASALVRQDKAGCRRSVVLRGVDRGLDTARSQLTHSVSGRGCASTALSASTASAAYSPRGCPSSGRGASYMQSHLIRSIPHDAYRSTTEL